MRDRPRLLRKNFRQKFRHEFHSGPFAGACLAACVGEPGTRPARGDAIAPCIDGCGGLSPGNPAANARFFQNLERPTGVQAGGELGMENPKISSLARHGGKIDRDRAERGAGGSSYSWNRSTSKSSKNPFGVFGSGSWRFSTARPRSPLHPRRHARLRGVDSGNNKQGRIFTFLTPHEAAARVGTRNGCLD